MQTHRLFAAAVAAGLATVAVAAQTPAQTALAQGKALWN